MPKSVWISAALLFSAGAALGAETPKFEMVPAKLYHVRGGLGNVFAKLDQGQQVRIAYLGGSITAQRGWRPKTLKWFQDRYPKAKVSQIHAAIGGTPSALGVFRLGHDALRHKPDLLFVEFSVNDGRGKPENIWRAMEGIVRQTWRADPTTDICFVYTFRVGYEKDHAKGLCSHAASAHEYVAEHYGIPSINMSMRIAELEREGKLVFKGDPKDPPAGKILFSKDGVHPLDAGHDIYRDVIGDAVIAMGPQSKPGPHKLGEPLIADNWEEAKLAPIEPYMVTSRWKKVGKGHPIAGSFLKRFPACWTASKPGEKLSFKFRGTRVALYDIVGPNGGNVYTTVDGKRSPKPRPRHDHYCTYWRLSTLGIASKLPDTVHTVSVEIDSTQPDRTRAMQRETNPNFDRSKYKGTNVWVGWIMVIGDIAK